MSIFTPALDKFSSKFFVAPANEYEVKVGAPRYRNIKLKDDTKMHIVSFPCVIVQTADGDATLARKTINADFIVDEDPESFGRLLRFVQACLGIKGGSDEADDEFRAKVAELDFSVDTDEGKLGAGYATIQDAHVVLNAGIRMKDEKQYQTINGARPF